MLGKSFVVKAYFITIIFVAKLLLLLHWFYRHLNALNALLGKL